MEQDIRIGTLAGKGDKTAKYIESLLPHGFESFQINFWQTLGGVSLKKLAKEVNAVLEGSGAVISSLGMFGNPLGGTAQDKDCVRGWRECIDTAHLFGTDIVAGFAGRVRNEPVPASMKAYKKVFGDLSKRAAGKGVRIAFENCYMGGTWETGDWNIAFCPAAWDMMFDAIDAPHIGLEWEPCHQMGQLIDPMPQIREYGHRFFHIHGKDASIHHGMIARHGIRGPQDHYDHRHPGFGDSNWTDIISELRRVGFKGCIDIEGWHDPVYKDKLELTGQVHALNYLKQCRTAFVPNEKYTLA